MSSLLKASWTSWDRKAKEKAWRSSQKWRVLSRTLDTPLNSPRPCPYSPGSTGVQPWQWPRLQHWPCSGSKKSLVIVQLTKEEPGEKIITAHNLQQNPGSPRLLIAGPRLHLLSGSVTLTLKAWWARFQPSLPWGILFKMLFIVHKQHNPICKWVAY